MRCRFALPSVAAEEEATGRMPPIRVNFELPYFTVSGIQVHPSSQMHDIMLCVQVQEACYSHLPKGKLPALLVQIWVYSCSSSILSSSNIMLGHSSLSFICKIMAGIIIIIIIMTMSWLWVAAGAVSEGHREEWLPGASLGAVHHHSGRVRNSDVLSDE